MVELGEERDGSQQERRGDDCCRSGKKLPPVDGGSERTGHDQARARDLDQIWRSEDRRHSDLVQTECNLPPESNEDADREDQAAYRRQLVAFWDHLLEASVAKPVSASNRDQQDGEQQPRALRCGMRPEMNRRMAYLPGVDLAGTHQQRGQFRETPIEAGPWPGCGVQRSETADRDHVGGSQDALRGTKGATEPRRSRALDPRLSSARCRIVG